MLITFNGSDEKKTHMEQILHCMGLSRDIALMGCQITELIKVARIACLSDMELYFGVETTEKMVNPRNEAAALSFLLQELNTTPGAPTAWQSVCSLHLARHLEWLMTLVSPSEQEKEKVLRGLTAFINGHELTSTLPCSPPEPEATSSASQIDG